MTRHSWRLRNWLESTKVQTLESVWHSPGTKIQLGKTLNSQASVIGVTPRNQLLDQFHKVCNLSVAGVACLNCGR